MTFGEWLRAQRLQRGWTLEMLAERANTTHASISRLESGRASASKKMALRLVNALAGTSADPAVVEMLRRDALAALVGLVAEDKMHAPPAPLVVVDAEGREWVVERTIGDDDGVITPQEAQILAALKYLTPKNRQDSN